MESTMTTQGSKLEPRDVAPTTATDPHRLLVDGVSEVLALAKPDGTIVFVSDSVRALHGHDPAQLIGTPALDLVDPVDRAEVGRRLGELGAAEEGDEQRMVVRLTRGDGGRVWADATARLIRSPEGDLLITVVAREATDRVETQTELSRIEARFRELVEWLPAIVYEAEPGPDGRFLYVSPQLQDTLGYTPDEWLARPSLWRESIHPDELEAVLEDERRQEQVSRDTDRRITSEYRMVDRSGRTVWVRDIARLSGVRESSFWRGVIVDITAEHSAQRALADAHERHRGMVDALPACSYRAERRAMGTWHFVSAQIQSLLGYSPAEWCADPTLWRASLHADDRERIELEEQEQMNQPPGTEFVSEYRLRHRSGRVVAVRDRGILTTGDAGEPMIEGILTDISAERAAEAVADGLADVYRLACGDCGATWAAERIERCPSCRSQNVESVSLNSTLSDLAASRQQVEGLLDGIQKHLEALGTNLHHASTQLTASPDEPDTR
jgi:PAS domain S-box-containing protein